MGLQKRGSVAQTTSTGGRLRWGADLPIDAADARSRLLDAAESCYEELGVGGTTVEDIAARAGVHRTTVYKYFNSRNELLLGVILREGEAVNARAATILAGSGPFAERLVRSCLASFADIEASRYLHLIFERSEDTPALTSAFEAFRDLTERQTRAHVEAAMAKGEIRDDLPVEALIRWMNRVFLGLVADPPVREEGDLEDVLRHFLVPSIAPRKRR